MQISRRLVHISENTLSRESAKKLDFRRETVHWSKRERMSQPSSIETRRPPVRLKILPERTQGASQRIQYYELILKNISLLFKSCQCLVREKEVEFNFNSVYYSSLLCVLFIFNRRRECWLFLVSYNLVTILWIVYICLHWKINAICEVFYSFI